MKKEEPRFFSVSKYSQCDIKLSCHAKKGLQMQRLLKSGYHVNR